MTNYSEILRLSSLGINNKRIAESMGIARQTVVTALQRAAAQGLDWQTAEPMSDRELRARLLPQGDSKPAYKVPDYEAARRRAYQVRRNPAIALVRVLRPVQSHS